MLSSQSQTRQTNQQRSNIGNSSNIANLNINPQRLPPPPPPLPAPPPLNNRADMDAIRNTMNAYLAMSSNARNTVPNNLQV